MRHVSVATMLALLPACNLLESGRDLDPDPEPMECFRDLCTSSEFPFEFEPVDVRLGVGAEVELRYNAHTSLRYDFEVVSSDPSILQVSRGVSFGSLIVRALRPGTASLVARHSTGEAIAERYVVTADIASIGFSWRGEPFATEPLDELAALSFSTDEIGVAFLDADGEMLAGRAPVTVDDPAIATVFESRSSAQLGLRIRHHFGLELRVPGHVTATVTLFDERTASLPIDVVAQPATHEIMFLRYRGDRMTIVSGPVNTDELLSAAIIGRTVDGRPVAGVKASWSASSSVKLGFYKEGEDVQFQVLAPGPATITAKVNATFVMAQLTAR